jgi:hypothetical protein
MGMIERMNPSAKGWAGQAVYKDANFIISPKRFISYSDYKKKFTYDAKFITVMF